MAQTSDFIHPRLCPSLEEPHKLRGVKEVSGYPSRAPSMFTSRRGELRITAGTNFIHFENNDEKIWVTQSGLWRLVWLGDSVTVSLCLFLSAECLATGPADTLSTTESALSLSHRPAQHCLRPQALTSIHHLHLPNDYKHFISTFHHPSCLPQSWALQQYRH